MTTQSTKPTKGHLKGTSLALRADIRRALKKIGLNEKQFALTIKKIEELSAEELGWTLLEEASLTKGRQVLSLLKKKRSPQEIIKGLLKLFDEETVSSRLAGIREARYRRFFKQIQGDKGDRQ